MNSMSPSPNNKIKIKICGLSEEAALRAAVESGADYVGFVHFEPSPRHVSLAHAATLQTLLPAHVESVLVVVNPDDALLADIAHTLRPAYIQLHGSESPTRVADIRRQYPAQKIIKALPISAKDDLSQASGFEPLVDMMLFDSKPGPLPGGNGVAFDWTLLKGFSGTTPWMLSGGLTAENVAGAIAQSGAVMVDVSSGVERSAGIKDADKIRRFIAAAQSAI
jgi:phosphoribosylanthranilate isomerase